MTSILDEGQKLYIREISREIVKEALNELNLTDKFICLSDCSTKRQKIYNWLISVTVGLAFVGGAKVAYDIIYLALKVSNIINI